MAKRITMAAATSGHAEGGSSLNAFDNALLVAGIGNINLVKISSIVPPEVALVELPKGSSTFKTITTSNGVQFPGSVQWDGTYITVFDQLARCGRLATDHGSTVRPRLIVGDAKRFVRRGATKDVTASDSVGFACLIWHS